MSPRPTLHVLTGPTAVGKTEWALGWAERFQAEIVSCDSLLVYRGMDIGTAKPTAAERARVAHHLIDVVSIAERYDVQRFVAAARAAVTAILGRGRAVLVTGGSGFYLRSFFGPVTDGLAVDPVLRAELEGRLAAEGLGGLVAELRRLNPEGLGTLDVANPRRVLRALERCRSAGRPLAAVLAEFRAKPGPFADCQVCCVRLDRPPAELDRRIRERVRAMLAAGLVAEVDALAAAGLHGNPSAAGAIGYREILDWRAGRIREEEVEACIMRNTRALVKKQRTWFCTQLPAHRVVAAGAPGDWAALFA